MKAINKDTKW